MSQDEHPIVRILVQALDGVFGGQIAGDAQAGELKMC